MKVGFTGTRKGMTVAQSAAVLRLLEQLQPTEAHHGDCIGADEQFHSLAYEATNGRVRRVIHPPINDILEAFCDGDERREPKDYMERNRDIVDECDRMIAAPETENVIMRSGTWATVSYTKRQRKPLYIVLPSGEVLTEQVGKVVT